MNVENSHLIKEENSFIKFVKEVAKYFMEFLDTDFKKSRIPKRNNNNTTLNGLKIGINLNKYPKLKNELLKILNDGFKKNELKIKKGVYTCIIPSIFLTLIIKKINDISEKEIDIIINEVEKNIEVNVLKYSKEYNKYLEESKEQTKSILKKILILPFLDDLDKPLESLDIADENSKYQLEIDIVDSLFSVFEEKYIDILEDIFKKSEDLSIKEALSEIMKLPEIKNNLIDFINNIIVGDAFYDIYQLYRNLSLIDKTEIYVYFYELNIGENSFPIFYTPVNILSDEKEFTLQFENRLFVNTKAINYIVQEYNIQADRKSTLVGEFDRILYLNESDTLSIIEKIIKKITNFFEFTKSIDINSSNNQKTGNLICSLSNNFYLYLFDKSDESLINDYEEIINDDGDIIDNFSKLIRGFIEDNPKPFMTIIDQEWQETSIPKRLVFESPIPLNTEQKQVLMTLQKPDCKFVILEGPPGTGKSHTITAIICKAILEGKSVLVLSDKKEALDVVEEKISTTLNKIRGAEFYQNPILRLGRTGNKFYNIVQGQALDKIRSAYYAYKHKEIDNEGEIKKTLSETEKNINKNIEYYRGINLNDIKYYFKNINIFSNVTWIDNENILDFSETKKEFLRIKGIVQRLKNCSHCNYKTNFVTDENFQKLIDLYDSFVEIGEIKKNFNNTNNHEELLKRFGELPYTEINNLLNLLEEIESIFILLHKEWMNSDFSSFKRISRGMSISKILDLTNDISITEKIQNESLNFIGNYPNKIELLKNFIFPEKLKIIDGISELHEFINRIKGLQRPIIGFMFQNDSIAELSRGFKKTFHFFNLDNPHRELKKIIEIHDLFEFIYEKLDNNKNREEIFRNIIYLIVHSNSTNKNKDHFINNKKNLVSFSNKLKKIKNIQNIPGIKLNEISFYISIFKLLKIRKDIQYMHSLPNIYDLEINTSSEHLLFENTEKDFTELNSYIKVFKEYLELKDDLRFLEHYEKNNHIIANKIGIEVSSKTISRIDSNLMYHSDDFIKEYFDFKKIECDLKTQFNNLPDDIYSDSILKIEELITAKMAYFLDKSIVDYTDNFAGEVQNLKNIIRKKLKFPKPLFQNLKKSFPCILSGIRDYAEYIPLEKDLFDLVIIDEASQVSIAQALPAIIRGKQLVVLGDDKQFSNVKAHNASNVTNIELRQKVYNTFYNDVLNGKDDYGWMIKVRENFDIKKSILNFLRFIRNYECQLKKHFRCYPEIISYSDKYFYGNSLQCMKIRGKSIEDVIKFDVIQHDGKIDETKNTNELEVNFIIKKLKEFKEANIEQSIGIITPHREQVTLLFDKISSLSISDWLFENCKLKIMTFDTCQGEERDYIFYSMVATREKDRLNWIFPVSFDTSENSIKKQRLNVGFSRAKETIHFVLSKDVDEYQYEIRKAMNHYKEELSKSKEIILDGTDEKSPMEKEIQKYFYQTSFYKNNRDKIELIPQFNIGQYLKQIDKDYKHPLFKIDFLLIYNNTQKIILEYDGFEEHFENLDEVNESNYQYYLKESDINRQKILEGYGYKFLRINKFNIGKNPVEALNNRLEGLVKKKSNNQLSLKN